MNSVLESYHRLQKINDTLPEGQHAYAILGSRNDTVIKPTGTTDKDTIYDNDYHFCGPHDMYLRMLTVMLSGDYIDEKYISLSEVKDKPLTNVVTIILLEYLTTTSSKSSSSTAMNLAEAYRTVQEGRIPTVSRLTAAQMARQKMREDVGIIK